MVLAACEAAALEFVVALSSPAADEIGLAGQQQGFAGWQTS
jgi:hypothetical protein